jgi:hypothetical protein
MRLSGCAFIQQRTQNRWPWFTATKMICICVGRDEVRTVEWIS